MEGGVTNSKYEPQKGTTLGPMGRLTPNPKSQPWSVAPEVANSWKLGNSIIRALAIEIGLGV